MNFISFFAGLDTSNDDIPISFLINTVLNPFLVSFEMVQMIASSLRDAALVTIGEIQVGIFRNYISRLPNNLLVCHSIFLNMKSKKQMGFLIQ